MGGGGGGEGGGIYSVFKFVKEIQLKKLVDQIFVVFLALSPYGKIKIK
jgi:hypothetical protein